jgi:hypothetical protein
MLLLSVLLAHAAMGENAAQESLDEKSVLVERLRLTDLCLFTEARYTRHLSQADLNTPFQDHTPYLWSIFPPVHSPSRPQE